MNARRIRARRGGRVARGWRESVARGRGFAVRAVHYSRARPRGRQQRDGRRDDEFSLQLPVHAHAACVGWLAGTRERGTTWKHHWPVLGAVGCDDTRVWTVARAAGSVRWPPPLLPQLQ